MKLFYYKDKHGNFGDDLNPLIWYTLFPNLFDDNSNELMLGIGTLINDQAPKNPKKIVFGSGYGYHDSPVVDSSWEFVWVRGKLTAERLGLSSNKAITDPAILIFDIVKDLSASKRTEIAFMPHHRSIGFADWRQICDRAQITYLDPRADVHETLFEMSRCKLIIAEAMHAAIVADSLRIPWIPVVCYDHILEFKWRDWCSSLNLSYEPVQLPRVWDLEDRISFNSKVKNEIKRTLDSVGIRPKKWLPPIPKSNFLVTSEEITRELNTLKHSRLTYLSSDKIHFQRLSQVKEQMHAYINGRTN